MGPLTRENLTRIHNGLLLTQDIYILYEAMYKINYVLCRGVTIPKCHDTHHDTKPCIAILILMISSAYKRNIRTSCLTFRQQKAVKAIVFYQGKGNTITGNYAFFIVSNYIG